MKTKEEIKKLATKNYRSNGSGGGQYTEGLQEGRIIGFIDGYNQCQEDMTDKKYTKEDMIKFAFDTYYYISGIMKVPFNQVSENRTHAEDNFKEYINSLNKQD
jgi:hypothetical protein